MFLYIIKVLCYYTVSTDFVIYTEHLKVFGMAYIKLTYNTSNIMCNIWHQ